MLGIQAVDRGGHTLSFSGFAAEFGRRDISSELQAQRGLTEMMPCTTGAS
jgi:hypothetical protein